MDVNPTSAVLCSVPATALRPGMLVERTSGQWERVAAVARGATTVVVQWWGLNGEAHYDREQMLEVAAARARPSAG